ncbi:MULTISPECIES: glycosyltransferase [Prevotellaceae]|uniref:glycosyltransferase n=1 Tax=Prevotellaceae TaxID=171552 RepID=UPI0003D2CA69|nr:glycosyltransferase [Prevotella phocaeensis]ETD21589.1 hypothetical protein HMPREF1199_00664 [Hoylesella oralis CC98A]
MNKLLSIIIPAYNAESYLRRCVDSIFKQGLNDNEFEVIIIDDGSQDKSYDIALAIASEHENIFVYTQGNSGQAVARNVGLEKAKGKYVMFVDSDDYLIENTIKRVLSIAEINCLDICETRLYEYDHCGNRKIGLIQPFPIDQIFTGEEALLNKIIVASVCTNVYLLEFIKKNHLSFVVGIAHEDVDFNMHAYAFAQRIMFLDICTYIYSWNPDSTDRSRDISRIKRGLLSDLHIAMRTKEYTNIIGLSKQLKFYYLRTCNSIIVSTFLTILQKYRWADIDFIKEMYEFLQDNKLYPIKGRTLSLNTTVLIPFINTQRVFCLCYIVLSYLLPCRKITNHEIRIRYK